MTARTIENMCKIITLTGSMVGFAYISEFFIAWYGGNPFEQGAFVQRAFGQYWWAYWIMMLCNVISPHLFWIKWCRTNLVFIFFISIVVNIGMWFERFVITASLTYDFLPANWAYYSPTVIDIATYVGSLGIFMTLFLLFARFLPMLLISEVKNVMHQAHEHLHPHDDDEDKHMSSSRRATDMAVIDTHNAREIAPEEPVLRHHGRVRRHPGHLRGGSAPRPRVHEVGRLCPGADPRHRRGDGHEGLEGRFLHGAGPSPA